MRTSKTFSTISFNTEGFLKVKLEELRKAGLISFWSYIKHQPEDDEGGKKEHIHLFVEPSKMIQTDEFLQEMIEPDPEKPDKPFKCIMAKSSKFDDWYMYGLHDKSYLSSKDQARKYHYVSDDFVSSDPDELNARVKSIDMTSLLPYKKMLDAINRGEDFASFFQHGFIPIQQIAMWRSAWFLLTNDQLYRNGKIGHEKPDENIADNVFFKWLVAQKGYKMEEARETTIRVIRNMELNEIEKKDYAEFLGRE